MTIYLLGDAQLDKMAIARLLSQKTGWHIESTDTGDENLIVCTSDKPPETKQQRLTVFLYSSSVTNEQDLVALDHKHDIQIDAATVDPATISEIIVNLLV